MFLWFYVDDMVYGFFQMVRGEFSENAVYEVFSCFSSVFRFSVKFFFLKNCISDNFWVFF